MSYNNMTKGNMIRGRNQSYAQERVSDSLVGGLSVAEEIKILKDSGKACSCCKSFIESLVRCRKGKKIISQFNICVKFEVKEQKEGE